MHIYMTKIVRDGHCLNWNQSLMINHLDKGGDRLHAYFLHTQIKSSSYRMHMALFMNKN